MNKKRFKITDLDFIWSCIIVTPASYGLPCGIEQTNEMTESYEYVIDGTRLESELIYQVTVLVSTTDGRNSVASITLSSTGQPSSGYAQVSGGSAISTKVDTNSRLTINGVVNHVTNSGTEYSASWLCFINGKKFDITSLTPTSTVIIFQPIQKNLKVISTQSSVDVPLVIPQNTLISGATIKFRLRINEKGSKYSTYSDVNIAVNQPPYGGSLEVNPSLGYSFSTTFIMALMQYSDDASDYPLSYSFSYQLSPSSNVLIIQLKSGLNSVRNILPAGYDFMNSQIIITGMVYDFLGSSNADIVKVTVKETKNVDYFSFLSNYLSNSLDVKSSLSVVNMVASSLSKVDCSSVSKDYCETLHRHPCQNTPQQCSSCKDGYVGIIGDSNIKCIDFTSGVV